MALVFVFIILFFFLLSIFTFVLFFFLALRDSAVVAIPFISTHKRAREAVINALSLSEESLFYDLGCGNADILKAAIRKTPGAKGVGVEKGYLPYLFSRFNTRNLPISISYGDIVSTDISDATHIYCYLSDSMMKTLSGKFLKECRPGTRIVSCDFRLPSLPLIQTISLNTGSSKLSKTLYIYQKSHILVSV